MLLDFSITHMSCILENLIVTLSAMTSHGSTVTAVEAIYSLTRFSCDFSWNKDVRPCPISSFLAKYIWEVLSLCHLCCWISALNRNSDFSVDWLFLARTIGSFVFGKRSVILNDGISFRIVPGLLLIVTPKIGCRSPCNMTCVIGWIDPEAVSNDQFFFLLCVCFSYFVGVQSYITRFEVL